MGIEDARKDLRHESTPVRWPGHQIQCVLWTKLAAGICYPIQQQSLRLPEPMCPPDVGT